MYKLQHGRHCGKKEMRETIRYVTIRAILVALFFVIVGFHSAQAVTTVPTIMNFQGRLANSANNIVANGTYNMKFRLYDALSGGTLVWSEDRLVSGGQGIAVTNGLFKAQLGSVTPLSASLFASGGLYLEIELPTPASATSASPVWTEGAMSPRNQLASSAYAYNAETLDGIDSSAFAQLGSTNAFTSASSITVSSANAFQVKNGSTNIFNIDTSTAQITLGTSDTNGVAFVLDTKTTSGDPGITTDGAMYYNSNSGKFRCYQSGWKDCLTDLQGAYDISSSPATITTSAAKGVKIAAGAAPTTDLFTVENTGQAVSTDNVNGVKVNYVGGTGAIEGAGIRVDYTPGGTTGSTWSGMRIVANNTGAVSGVTEYGLKLEGPGSPGSGTEVGVGVAGGFDIGVDIASGGLQMADEGSDPSAPAAGNLRVYSRDIAGRMLLKMKGPSGLDTALQPALFTNNVAMLLPSTGATITVWGMQNTTVGTASTPTISTADLANSMRRVRVTSAATANAASELRSTQPLVWRGNSSGLGGFFYATRFRVNSTTANQQLFSGLMAATGATSTTAVPSALVNMVGVGWDSADSNLQMMSNDNTGTAAKADLGASFPANNTSAVYELIMFAPPNGSSIGYRVTRLDTGAVTAGTLSADIPQNTVVLTHHQYMNNGGTAAAVVLDVNRVYIESDY